MLSWSRQTISKPSEQHTFQIPALRRSNITVRGSSEDGTILKGSVDKNLQVPPSSYFARSRPSVTADSILNGRNAKNGFLPTKQLIPDPLLFTQRSCSLSNPNGYTKPKPRQSGKERQKLQLYKIAGDSYGHIATWETGITLTPYGFPVLQSPPCNITDESVYVRQRYETLSTVSFTSDRESNFCATPAEQDKEGDSPSVQLDINYDPWKKLTVASVVISGIQTKGRIVLVVELASHIRKKHKTGPLPCHQGVFRHDKDISFFRIAQEHMELSQIKDVGRLKLMVCYHSSQRRLLVTVIRATDLPRKPFPPDTFVEIEVTHKGSDTTMKRTTKLRPRTSNPVYKEVFAFVFPHLFSEVWGVRHERGPLKNVAITVSVCRKILFFKHSVIGQVTLTPEVRTSGYSHLLKCTKLPYQPITEWHDLKSSG
ncbi:uncharacterized protein [Diadema antillarum]|uniref:uncharacterized protein n=1 Tax=Diadema antillarum TaxID=105358 RepID=UPI003A8C60BF